MGAVAGVASLRKNAQTVAPDRLVRLALAGFVVLFAEGAPAAVEYRCGEGGKPNKSTKVCDCPPGKVESTDGKGVSTCVIKPATKPMPKPSSKPPPVVTAPPPMPPPPPAPTSSGTWPIPAPPPAKAPPGTCPSGMATIPGGKLRFDKDDATLAPYCLDVTEVTVQAFATCVAAGKCSEPIAYVAGKDGKYLSACNWKVAGRDKHPVNCVTEQQAEAYCAFAGRRLPTGAEFMWAYRAGDMNRLYPWGDAETTPLRLNACGKECATYQKYGYMPGGTSGSVYDDSDPFSETAPVASFPATTYGLFDMAGNVEEWTSTFGHIMDNGFGAKVSDTEHVVMGGSYAAPDKQSFWRLEEHYGTYSPLPTRGFRCARAL